VQDQAAGFSFAVVNALPMHKDREGNRAPGLVDANGKLNGLIFPDPVKINISASNAPNAAKWTSLFSKLPKNAEVYVPKEFKNMEEDGVMVLSPKVQQARMDFWTDYMVGFFLDSNPNYQLVKVRCNQVWKPRGGLSVHYDNYMYFLKFARCEERQRILEADPIIIEGKPFITMTWSPSMDQAK